VYARPLVFWKINKLITKKQLISIEKILEASNKFVSMVKYEISLFGPENVFNTDQSGFNLESHSHTSFKGLSKG